MDSCLYLRESLKESAYIGRRLLVTGGMSPGLRLSKVEGIYYSENTLKEVRPMIVYRLG